MAQESLPIDLHYQGTGIVTVPFYFNRIAEPLIRDLHDWQIWNMIINGRSIMMFVQCRICKYWVPDDEIYCPNCGHKSPYKKPPTFWSLILFFASLISHGIFYLTILFSFEYALDFYIFMGSLVIVSLSLLGVGLRIDLYLRKVEKTCKKYLIDDEHNIAKRIKDIEERISKIDNVRERVMASEQSDKTASMLTLLENAHTLLVSYRNRYQLEFWKIALIRWKNSLEPIEFEWQKCNYNECTEKMEALARAVAEGKQFVSEYSENALAGIPEGSNVIGDFHEALAVCSKFNEGLLARQARLAINDVSPLEERSKDLKTAAGKENYKELFNARSDVSSFVEAFEELEAEFDRLEAEEQLALE